jgi:DNA-binding NtrC family response regulator
MPKVLLIENDPLHAILRKSVLETRFSPVERVADPASALCLVEQPGKNFDLVVCGSQPPGFGGAALVQELHFRRPGLPVLVLGGQGVQPADYQGPDVLYLASPVEGDEILFYSDKLLSGSPA